MTYPATLTPPSATALNFLIAKIDAGFPLDQIANVVEPLVTPGTDGKRLRVRRREFVTFQMETWMEAADYPAAVALARSYLAAIGLPCTLAWTGATFTGTWNLVLVEACVPEVLIGKIDGANASGTATAAVRAMWRITAQALAGASP